MSFINGFISAFTDFWTCLQNINFEWIGKFVGIGMIGFIIIILVFIIIGVIADLIFNDDDYNDYML